MPATRLGLYELLAPQFLLGFTIPDHVDKYLSTLGVDTLRTSFDENAVVYSGRASFGGEGGASPVLKHEEPSGAVFEFSKDFTIDFRLTLPRDGADFIKEAVDALAAAPAGPPDRDDLQQLFNDFGPVNQNLATRISTEYPGVGFRLELLVASLTIHLGQSWIPGKVSGGRVVPDLELAGQDVKFVLPKIVLEYEQGLDPTHPVDFRLKSWGNSGFDAPSDLAVGEFVRMEPPIALREDGRWAFGVDQILVDLSEDHTPPEILERFGTDEGFEGLLVKSARVYYEDADKDWALNFAVNDVLISFAGEVSLEAEFDYIRLDKLTAAVEIYDGKKRLDYQRGKPANPAQPTVLTGGKATVPNTAVIHVQASGGVPPYTIGVDFVTVDTSGIVHRDPLWDSDERIALISPGMVHNPPILRPPAKGWLEVTVEDSTPNAPLIFSQTLDPFEITAAQAANVESDGMPADHPPGRAPATLTVASPSPPPNDYRIVHAPTASGTREIITVVGGNSPEVRVNGELRQLNEQREVMVDVGDGANIAIDVTYPEIPGEPETFYLYFGFDQPYENRWPASMASYVKNEPNPLDDEFLTSTGRKGVTSTVPPGSLTGADALKEWLKRIDETKGLKIDAHASKESPSDVGHDQDLSQRRLDVVKGIINNPAIINPGKAHGHTNPPTQNNPDNRVVEIQGTTKARPQVDVHATISRPAAPAPKPDHPVVEQTVPPPPPLNKKPRTLRRLGARVRLERNDPVLAEVYGQLDFETEFEEKLRTPETVDSLEFRPRSGATADPNPQDGVVDFKIHVTYDPATHFLMETLTLGAHPEDRDGLLEMTNEGNSTLKNIFGALLLFAPIINNAADAFADESAGDWVRLIVDLGVPIAIGGLGVFKTEKATLYGGELKLRQYVPSLESAEFTDASIVFDYGVAFKIDIDALDIHSTKPLKVRYKAIGFNLHFPDGDHYQPVFDTSKGYEIDLSDPGLFSLPAPLGNVLKIMGARIARFNPLTLELDLGLKVDLGVVTVDRFKVKVPLDPPGAPMILPTGVKLDISNVVTGSGYVDIRDNGLRGAIDVTIVPLKLRVAGNLAVESIEDAAPQRQATAVFASLVAEFPSPIAIAATGLGLYGMSGLFAMHYKRLEAPRPPGDSVSPALRWLEKAEGAPTNLVNSSGQLLWGPEFDRWSFGVGLILGTMEGGTLINTRGMFVLELPGPRILIFTKIQVLKPRPGLGDSGLTTGILGLIDLDFNLQQITIGVLIDYSIRELISIRVPIEIFFKLNDPENWHLHLGTFDQPVTAKVLGIERGRGYFMISGSQLALPIREEPLLLPGIAVATGIQQSLVIGDTDIGLYLKIAAGAHLGIAFSPFFLAGRLYLDGELRLFIVSVEAHGHFDVEAPDPTYIHGEICGKVDFFFFDVKGCVAFSIGDSERQLPAPPLVKNVFLQSHAPVIAAGQGGDRPIDASLGDAVMLANGTVPAGAEIPTVPIDTVPVLQLHASPLINADNTPTATFTNNLTTPPGLTGGGWVNVGGGRQVQYKLREIALNPPPPASPEKPPATWRRDRAPGREGIDTNIDLALFSRVPMTASRAVERSTELHGIVTTRWSGLCDPIAPEACVLWTFCEQPFGPSEAGWHLKGIPEPDPPGTQRHSPPPTDLYVESPTGEPGSDLLDVLVADGVGALLTPAKVIGLNTDLPDPNFDLGCFRALQLPMTSQQDASGTALPNPQDADDYADKLSNNRWVTFHTGAAESATFFLAFSRQYSEAGRITVRELDAEGTVRREASLFDLPFQQVTGVTNGLPSEWTDPNGPWYDQVLPVATFLADEQFSALLRAVVQLKPIEGCERIQLVTASTADDLEENRVIVGVVEVCSTEERDRVLEGESIQTGEMQTLTDYLTGGDVVPLLAPNQTYTLTVRYDAVSKAQDGSESTEANLQQQFRFHTDAAVPERLDPWVLGITPDPDEMYHFYADPIQVVFNDLSVIQLFSAYGKNLRFSVRGADGVAVTIDPPLIEALDPVSSELSTPLRELLKALIDGGFLPCMGQTEIPLPPHGSATVPVTLRPLMAYTFDIEVQPPHASGNGEAVRPLFRRSFSTSKFPNLKALVEEVRARRIRHRGLASQLTGLPVGAPVAVASDQDIQDALINAGEQALPAPSSTGVTIYWARRSGETCYSPHAILIDAAEPLWRTRVEPRLETVPDQDDPAFQRVVLQNVPAMEVIEQSPLGAHVTHFVRSPSGTRTLAVMSETFNPPAAGEDVVLAVHRLASSLYGTPEDTEVLLDIPLGPRAPWEEDEE